MIRKKLFLILCISFLFLVTSCSRPEKGTQTFPVTYTLADVHPEGFPTVVGAQYFAKLVNERTRGRITINVVTDGKAGDESSTIEKVQFGQLAFTRTSLSPLTSYSPDMNALMVPFEYKSAEHFWYVLNGKIGKDLLSSLQNTGFYGLCYYDSGARSFYATKPMHRMDDLAGMKIRVQPSALMMDFVSALGAVPSPIEYGDVFAALKKGTINGAENNIPSYESSGQYKIARYYMLDEHSRIPDIIIGSKKILDRLSVSDRSIIFAAAKESVGTQRIAWTEYESAAYRKVCKDGCSFITINAVENKKTVENALAAVDKRLSPSEQKLVKQIKSLQ